MMDLPDNPNVTDPDEAGYLAKQLGLIASGDSSRVHNSTLTSLRRRGFVEGYPATLTTEGRAVLAWAQGACADG
jgi:hypothetical protein